MTNEAVGFGKSKGKDEESGKGSGKESNSPKTGTDYSIVTVGFLLLAAGLALFVIHKKKEKSA